MQRYFIEPAQFGEKTVTITGDDAKHIGRVMRSKPGDKLIVSDGESRDALAAIIAIDPQEVTAEIIETLEPSGEPWFRVTVAQSLPKGDKMETVIQKCTEIGAASFLPFLSERTVVQYDGKKKKSVRRVGVKSPRKLPNKRIAAACQPWILRYPGASC